MAKRTLGYRPRDLLTLLLVALAIPLTVLLVERQQELRGKAYEEEQIETPLAPYVEITSPSEGEQIEDETSINVAILNEAKIKGVEFYIDSKLKATVGEKPYIYVLNDVEALTSGFHTITVRAYDDNLNVGTKTITVYTRE